MEVKQNKAGDLKATSLCMGEPMLQSFWVCCDRRAICCGMWLQTLGLERYSNRLELSENRPFSERQVPNSGNNVTSVAHRLKVLQLVPPQLRNEVTSSSVISRNPIKNRGQSAKNDEFVP